MTKGVISQVPSLPAYVELALNTICAEVDPQLFTPIVYRVDIDTIPLSRRHVAGSGLVGSREYLIDDLRESEFDVLFFDPDSEPLFGDPDMRRLGNYLTAGVDVISPVEALRTLWLRRVP
jgi:hypothetical protein